MSRDAALWTGILAGPVIWLLSFEANFALAPWACHFQGKLALYLVSIVAFAITAGSLALAWRQWKALGKQWPDDAAGAIGRTRVMALSGVLVSAMFCLVIAAQSVPEMILGACE